MDEKENLQETAQEEVSADLSYDEFLTEDPADPEDTQEFSLEDIMKEFGASVPEEPAEEAPAEEATEEEVPEAAQQLPEELEDTPEEPPQPEPVTGDTVRLDTGLFRKHSKKVKIAEPIPEEPEPSEPFSEQWEPEYEQPMGEYVPPQPIAFHPRSRIRELKRKLVAGPEKKYFELAEKGLGKLQALIFLSVLVVLLAAGSTVLYAMDRVQPDRMKLMVFGQFLAMLVAALLGSQQLVEGVADLFKKRFTLNTLLVFTFLICCADGVLCLKQQRVPCCAAFSLEMTMSLWSAYHQRHAQMGQMDTLRKANRLDGIMIASDYYKGRKGLLRVDGDVDDFMDRYQTPSVPEKVLCWYALFALVASLGIGVYGYLQNASISLAIQLTAVSLLAAVPATAFITLSRPLALLQRKLHAAGAVVCGWQGAVRLRRRAVFPVEYRDLFPTGSARMNGVKFFGSRPTDEVVAYVTAVVTANESGLAPIFNQVLDSRNGYHYDATELTCYSGGISGKVEGEQVLVGSMEFLKEMGVETPDGLRVNQAVCVAIEGELCGLFAITYENTKNAAVGLAAMCSGRSMNPIFVTDDFLLDERFIRSRFGVNPRRLIFVDPQQRQQLRERKPDEGQPAVILVTRDSLAACTRGITGAKALRSACNMGLVVHLICGLIGLGVMVVLLLLGALHLLTPVNMFLYQLVWMIPGLLITEWTRTV